MGKYDHINFKAPESVRAAYRRGIDLHEKGQTGDGIEASTIAMARKIAGGESVSPEWARKGNRFWGRNRRFLELEKDSPGYASAMLWGGRPGIGWFSKLVEQMDDADKQPEGNMSNLYVHVRMQVNAQGIRRETRHGDEFIVIPSKTLPDNVVMNRGLYPADEIEKSYRSLEGTLAPLGHPKEGDSYVSATSRYAVDHYDIGGVNENVRRENGAVLLDKAVNVRKALETDRGRRLLDRINALEKGTGEPIHTSTGIFLKRIPCDTTTNQAGDEYDWTASEMVFDHDCFLLDEPGAATPEKGVGAGLGVNCSGDECEVMLVNLDISGNRKMTDDEARAKISEYAKSIGFANLIDSAHNTDNSKTQSQNNGDDHMKREDMIKALKEANKYKDGMKDEEVQNAYERHMADKEKGKKDDEEGKKPDAAKSGDPVTNSQLVDTLQSLLKPLKDDINALKANQQAQDESKRSEAIATIVNAKMLDEAHAKTMETNTLLALAESCSKPGAVYAGAGLNTNSGSSGEFADYDINAMMDDK